MSLVPTIVNGDWESVRVAIQKLASSKLGPLASPKFTGLTLAGLTASNLLGTDTNKAFESVTVSTGLSYTNSTLSLSHLGLQNLTDPNADRIFFWDDSAGASKWLTVSTGLQISTTNLTTKDSEIVHDNLSGVHQNVNTTADPTFAGLVSTGDVTINTGQYLYFDGE